MVLTESPTKRGRMASKRFLMYIALAEPVEFMLKIKGRNLVIWNGAIAFALELRAFDHLG